MARKCKEEENTSGDNFLLKKLNCGKMVAAIADGCGSGKRAFAESRMVIELMENCIEAGFEEKTAIDLINSAYIAGTDVYKRQLVQRTIAMVKAIKLAASVTIPAGQTSWGSVFIANGLQLIIAILLIVLGVIIVVNSVKSYAKSEKNSEKTAA